MTEAERIARAAKAARAFDEFLAPMFDEMDGEYSARILEVANNELLFWRRTSKLTRLADALRTVRSLRSGMKALIADGEAAQSDKARAEKVRQMTEPKRRLLTIAGY